MAKVSAEKKYKEREKHLLFIERVENAIVRINNGENNGSMTFSSQGALVTFLGLHYDLVKPNVEKLRESGFVFPEAKKLIPFDERIRDGIERIKNGENNGSMTFSSQGALATFLAASKDLVKSNVEKLRESGFVFPEAKKLIPFDERIRDAIERIKNGENDGSMTFSSPNSLATFLAASKDLVKSNVEKLRELGFVYPDPIEYLSFFEKANKGIERIENGENDGSMAFPSQKALTEFLGVGHASVKQNLKKLKEFGYQFPEAREVIPFDNRVKDGIERIENGENNGSMTFSSPNSLATFLGVSYDTVKQNLKKLKELGYQFPEVREEIPFEEKANRGIERIKNGENDGSMRFSSVTALANFLATRGSSLQKNLKKARELGYEFPEVIEQIPFDERANGGIERIENGENNGSMTFSSLKVLATFLGCTFDSVKRYSKKARELGYEFPEMQTEVSKNITLAIEECKTQGVKLERGDLIPDISKEFFSKHIRPLENKDNYQAITTDIVRDYRQEEKISFVKESVVRLMSEDRGDYSLLELKLELFARGVYFSEDSIIEALISLGENITREDSIQKRLRLSAAFVNHGLVEIEYVDALPMLNNSLSGNVIIDRRVDNKKTLMKLWREYALYSIKNEITGHVSKTKIPDDWDGKLDSLFSIIPSYEKAYLLDEASIWFLEKVGYEGILALCQFGSKQSKASLTQIHRSIHARCIGFFMYLNRKKYALLQPKYIIFTGANSVSDTVRTIMDDHVVTSGFKRVLEMDDVPQIERKKLGQKNVDLQALKFAGSVLDGCDLSVIPSKDIYAYLEHNSHEVISGTIIHETFILALLCNLGNLGAIQKQKEFDLDKEIVNLKYSSGVRAETFNNYKKLLSEFTDVVRKLHEEGMSNAYVKQYLNIIFVLMKFLDTFPKKLNRKEMTAVLNTVICSDVDNSFTVWGRKNLSDGQYTDFTTKMFVLFDNIAVDEYKGLYSRSWKVGKKTRTGTLIREGMDAEAYSILQNVAIYDPARADEYPFVKTTPQGEQLDLGWWPHDFPPIPVICNWLIIKTTRRKVNVRHLDVNSFLRFDEEGNLTHMHFNTDKNRSTKESDIEINLLKYIFTPEELSLLEKYVDYIKNAYSSMAPVSYESSSKHFGEIMPLFPHHNINAVMAEHWADGYHIKTMLKTEMILKTEVKKGAFDHFIEEQDRERRKDDLAKIKLVSRKPAGVKELPSNIGELDNISIPSYTSNFAVTGGIHNMRHAGISALGAQLPLVYVRMIAGHTDINTTFRVYFHANDEIIGYEIGASLNEPVGAGSKFIRVNIMPFVESENPEEIEKILLDNHFMTASREIQQVSSEREMIEDGLSRGATLHPSLWVPQKHGVCVNNQQCPLGTNGCCALCPFNMFSPMHIKGVIYELNTCLEDIALISQKIALDARDGVNVSREEMKGPHQQKIKEMAAWFEVLEMINNKMKALGYNVTKNLPVTLIEGSSKDLYSMGASTIEESMMELLVDAKTLQIDDLETDNRISKISHKLMQAAIHRKDYGALDRMANEGIQYIVDEYGKKAVDEKKEYLLQHLRLDRLIDNSVSLVSGSKAAELLPAI